MSDSRKLTLIILGSPLWLSLLIAILAIVISVFSVLCAAIISLWACFGAAVASAFAGIIGGIILAFTGYLPSGIALIAAALVCGGLSFFFFFGCKAATCSILLATKKIMIWLKKSFIKKEAAQ